ncbi:MAG: hypothetical protein E6Q57_00295 [Mycobacterium sp.]|nr:MAG: hypothetical protein E6Q57_00295 [Mycobacterium sp.]
MTDLDIAPLRPLQLGVVTGTEVAWVAPADPVRVRGADLGEVARRASAARRDHPHSDVVVDIDFVIAHDARSARALTLAGGDEPDRQTLLYVGTPAGLAGLIADIHALNIADGAVLIPRAAGVAELIPEAVLPVLRTMARLPVAVGEVLTA